MHRHNGLLYSADGSANLIFADPPQNAEKHQGWARDSFGYGYIKFAPQPVSYRHQGRTYTADGCLIVTGATPGAANDYKDGYGALCRADGALYIGSPGAGRRHQGWLVNSNGSAAVDGFGFFLGLGDKGSGEVDLVPGFANGSATPTFTRATTATTINSAGLIVSVASGTPRSWYWPDTLAYGGYLAEGARTNLCLQSEDLTSASWVNTRSAESGNAVAAPDGATTADKLTEDATAANSHFTSQSFTFTAAVHTVSVFVKAAERTACQIALNDGTTNHTGNFNIATGAVGSVSNVTSTITAYPNGWYRCTITTNAATAAAAGTISLILQSPAGTNNYNGDGASGMYFWGAQLEAASFASSYIPTTTASVTRNADVLTYVFAGNADATVGTAYAELGTEWSAATGVVQLAVLAGAAGSGALWSSTVDAPTATRITDGTTQIIKSGLTSMATASRKRASSWGGAGLAVTGDGATVASGAFDGDMGSTIIAIGCNASSVQQWFGPIKNVAIYRKKVSSEQLVDMT